MTTVALTFPSAASFYSARFSSQAPALRYLLRSSGLLIPVVRHRRTLLLSAPSSFLATLLSRYVLRARFSPKTRRCFCTSVSTEEKTVTSDWQREFGAREKVGAFRKRIRIVDVKGGPDEGLDRVGQRLSVRGWVRTSRVQSTITFMEVNDGSCLSNMQCVINPDVQGYDQITSGFVTTGASVWVEGILVESQGSKQKVELRVEKLDTIGQSDPYFPIQKKEASREYLRTVANLCPRTNTFGANREVTPSPPRGACQSRIQGKCFLQPYGRSGLPEMNLCSKNADFPLSNSMNPFGMFVMKP